MLLFLDQPKSIRVVRVVVADDGTTGRERLGVIMKSNLELSVELEDACKQDERQDVEDYIAHIRSGRALEMKCRAFKFPETLREMVEYIADGADPTERHLLVTSILEAVRQIRKLEKENTL